MPAPSAPRVAIADYGIGNLRSVQKALQIAGADAFLATNADELKAAKATVLPGVGHFGRCVEALGKSGLRDAVVEAADSGRTFLAICVGMQMLFETSAEAPGVPGLGILQGHVEPLSSEVKRPQMQWNQLTVTGEHTWLGALDRQWMYFVHSYAVRSSVNELAHCDYGGRLVAIAGNESIVATQFHPEKSSKAGLGLLKSFVARAR